MGLLVHLTWGDSWRRPKEGLGRVVDAIQKMSTNMPKPVDADDPSVDIYIYVSGAVWQHEDEGFKLGTLNARGRNWLRIMIYVPDHLTGHEESETYFTRTLEDVAVAVEARLLKRRPGWPIDTLVEQIRQLKPTA
ncbi:MULTISPECIES: hypothetical protein [unclassified Knoellia]|uniref:hypothetical protein n=1 Tax=Knoellia altitudinis TaxID=3404795 RepID=UPI0036169342